MTRYQQTLSKPCPPRLQVEEVSAGALSSESSLVKPILVILGPTASGKSDLAVALAKKYNGEVISADSRQVYKGLDIGSGKITKTEMKGVPHHLLDVARLSTTFSVSNFQKKAKKAIAEIKSRGKLPIICGGTGFYIQSIVDNTIFPEVKPNKKLRAELATYSTDKLFKTLQKLDPDRAKTIEKQNPVRLIRAIEIAKALGKVPPPQINTDTENFIQIGLKISPEKLQENIVKRLDKRLKKGMLKEAEKLHKDGLSWKRMEALGLEYRNMALFLQNKISKEEMTEKIKNESWQYAKRQMTWFKRDPRIKWATPEKALKIRLK